MEAKKGASSEIEQLDPPSGLRAIRHHPSYCTTKDGFPALLRRFEGMSGGRSESRDALAAFLRADEIGLLTRSLEQRARERSVIEIDAARPGKPNGGRW